MVASAILTGLYVDDDSFLLAKAIGEFGSRELAPYLKQLEREAFPERFLPLAAKSGFLGTVIPEEYGGQGGGLQGFLTVLEGIAACDGSLALTLAAHESLTTTHIFLGGTDEQKRKYLPELTSGRKIGAWCLTEPQAGSNIFKDTPDQAGKNRRRLETEWRENVHYERMPRWSVRRHRPGHRSQRRQSGHDGMRGRKRRK